MRFQLLISCNNEAFGEDDPEALLNETRRILRRVHDAIRETGRDGPQEHTVRDFNGNTVGTWAFIAD